MGLSSISLEVWASLLGTFMAALIGTLVPLVVLRFTHYEAARAQLQRDLIEINRLSLEYPYLENPQFIGKYAKASPGKRSQQEKFIRYDSYCSIWFNHIESLAAFNNYNTKKIERFLNIGEVIRAHSAWWQVPENRKEIELAYNQKFRQIVQKYLE